MSQQYLALAQPGKNDWWRYVVSILVILFFWQFIGAIPAGILVTFLMMDGDPSTQFHPETFQFEGVDPLWSYLAINFSFITLFIGLYIAIRFLHNRSFMTLITPNTHIRWGRLFLGFWVYFLLITMASLVEAVIFPGRYQFTLDLNQFLTFLPIALVITPIQTSTEELFFRGYLMQGIGLKSQSSLIPILLSSILFMLPHLLNPEISQNFSLLASLYFIVGVFLAFITVRDNSLELAIGAHAANNLFIALVVNYPNSALPSPSIFTSQLDPLFSFISFVVIAIIFCLVLLRRRSPPSS